MVFAHKVWAILVGIKDAFALLFLLLFFWALYAVLTARPNPGLVRDGALLLKLDGAVVEEKAKIDPIALLLGQGAPTKEYRERDLVRAIEAAADDGRIKAVVLDLDEFAGGGQVHLERIGAALDKVRKANKPVLTHAIAYADDSLLLAKEVKRLHCLLGKTYDSTRRKMFHALILRQKAPSVSHLTASRTRLLGHCSGPRPC